jgi:hypothetical protein
MFFTCSTAAETLYRALDLEQLSRSEMAMVDQSISANWLGCVNQSAPARVIANKAGTSA